MMGNPKGNQRADVISFHLPFRIVRRGGRKEMLLPDGAANTYRSDNTLIKALARDFRWKRMLQSGAFAADDRSGDEAVIAPHAAVNFHQARQ